MRCFRVDDWPTRLEEEAIAAARRDIDERYRFVGLEARERHARPHAGSMIDWSVIDDTGGD